MKVIKKNILEKEPKYQKRNLRKLGKGLNTIQYIEKGTQYNEKIPDT